MMHFLKKFSRAKERIHLDYASTTPVAPEVLKEMLPFFSREWANPSAIYQSGVISRTAVEAARTEIARLLRIRREGVVFTSGGTESNNLIIAGVVEALHDDGRAYEDMEILTTAIEHPSILEISKVLERRGVAIRYLDVTEEGLINDDSLASSLTAKTVLVTFAYVNSEVGVIQDVKRITRHVRQFNASSGTGILVHLDASQAPLWLPCEMDMLGVDTLTLDAGKCYGPKGVGVLAMRHGIKLSPFLHGGGQEGGLRSGTENVPLIIGCAAALVRAQRGWEERSRTVQALRDIMIRALQSEIPDVVLNGSRERRVANNINISIPGIDPEYAVITLDSHSIAASTRSACGSRASYGSYVVRGMTNDEARANSTLRFTLGESTTVGEIKETVHVLKEHVLNMRRFTQKLHKNTV